MSDLKIFKVGVEVIWENVRRDQDGWVPGKEPGQGNYLKPEIQYRHVVASREEQAKEWVEDALKYSLCKHPIKIVSVEEIELDRIILEF